MDQLEIVLNQENACLARCILVDSRHGSRTDTAKDLRAAHIFEEIVEAESLSSAMERLAYGEFDACLIGKSVRPSSAECFVKNGKEIVKSKDCAFFAIVTEAEVNGASMVEHGVHGFIEHPCTKRALAEEVILAVIRANQDHPMKSMLMASSPDLLSRLNNEYFQGFDVPEQVACQPRFDANQAPASVIPEQCVASEGLIVKKSEADDIIEVCQRSAKGLEELISNFDPTQVQLEHNGKLPLTLIDAIREMTQRVFAGRRHTPRLASFKTFFEEASIEWFVDMMQSSKEQANQSFKMKLMIFAESGSVKKDRDTIDSSATNKPISSIRPSSTI